MEDVPLYEVRCVCGALLCKVNGNAVVECSCRRCHSLVRVKFEGTTRIVERLKDGFYIKSEVEVINGAVVSVSLTTN